MTRSCVVDRVFAITSPRRWTSFGDKWRKTSAAASSPSASNSTAAIQHAGRLRPLHGVSHSPSARRPSREPRSRPRPDSGVQAAGSPSGSGRSPIRGRPPRVAPSSARPFHLRRDDPGSPPIPGSGSSSGSSTLAFNAVLVGTGLDALFNAGRMNIRKISSARHTKPAGDPSPLPARCMAAAARAAARCGRRRLSGFEKGALTTLIESPRSFEKPTASLTSASISASSFRSSGVLTGPLRRVSGAG